MARTGIKKKRPKKPRRSYKAVFHSLRQVLKIKAVAADAAISDFGNAALGALPIKPLRLSVWNLCKGSGAILFEHDFRMLLYRSDLILTQEALLSERLVSVFKHPSFRAVHAASYIRRDGLRDGVMTVSRSKDEGKCTRVVCKFPEPVLQTPKVALVSVFPLQHASESLMVVNVHAKLLRTQKGAAEEMHHLMDHLPKHQGPMILAGDFNTFNSRYLKIICKEVARLGLELIPITEDPRAPMGALDQVFVRGLKVTRAFVDTTIRNSDHFPLFLDLWLP